MVGLVGCDLVWMHIGEFGGIVGLFGEKMQEFEERWDLDWQEYEVEGERKLARDGWQVSPPGEVEGEEEEEGKALGEGGEGYKLGGQGGGSGQS